MIPAPLPDHPGNVFLLGETVAVRFPDGPADTASRWRVFDDRGTTVAGGQWPAGQADPPRVDVGALDVGWYRAEALDAGGTPLAWTTAAVLPELRVPVPHDSPVCVDAATVWFARRYPDQQTNQRVFANLAALAGVNWIRDRLSWGELETAPGTLADETPYHSAATLQAEQALSVLQVFHHTPGWAVDRQLDGDAGGKRFARDLRHHYRFCQAMARTFRGRIRAWEPWNEANITAFGGHTIDEMCALQKASYLGFKAGDPDVTVCWNVYAGAGGERHTAGVLDNEAWAYFNTYNIHSYQSFDRYAEQFRTAREAACGRPIWITECGIRLDHETGPPWGDLSTADELRQARFVAKSYASSLFAGVDRHFFFILGNYLERGVQFGLLRHEHTPRPAYVALAALGRWLAGAHCLGRVPTAPEANVRIYAFSARPDGQEQDVLIAWADEGAEWPASAKVRPLSVVDYLGRKIGESTPSTLGPEAVFIVLAPRAARDLRLEPVPPASPVRPGVPSPVVLQLVMPHTATRLGSQAHAVRAGAETTLAVHAYNFSSERVSGTVKLEHGPAGWNVAPATLDVTVKPMERKRLELTVTPPRGGRELLSGVRLSLRGAFGTAGGPVVAFRLIADPVELTPGESRPISSAARAAAWSDNIVEGASMEREQAPDDGVLFDMQFADADPWGYPFVMLQEAEVPSQASDGIRLEVQVLEGTGNLRVQFVEECGAAYLAELAVDPEKRTPQRAVALFSSTKWGSYSKPDPNRKLDPTAIRKVMVGINAKRQSRVRFLVRNLEWVRY